MIWARILYAVAIVGMCNGIYRVFQADTVELKILYFLIGLISAASFGAFARGLIILEEMNSTLSMFRSVVFSDKSISLEQHQRRQKQTPEPEQHTKDDVAKNRLEHTDSEENSTDSHKTNQEPTTAQTTQTPKGRSLTERCLVWGGIVVLLVIVLFEWSARNGYSKTLVAWEAARKANDEGSGLVLTEADKLVRGFPSTTSRDQPPLSKVLTYTWSGLFRSHSIRLQIDLQGEPTVLMIDSVIDP